MNNDRLNFRTPWYLGDKFAGFQYWEFEHGRVKLIGDCWKPWVSKRDELTAKPDEQCTGFSDKNGKLIYENDRVGFYVYEQDENWYGGIGTVIWYNSSWRIETSGRFIHFESDIPMANPQGIEIIGNVHEQAEQKDIK